jgi:hypothetical protein
MSRRVECRLSHSFIAIFRYYMGNLRFGLSTIIAHPFEVKIIARWESNGSKVDD